MAELTFESKKVYVDPFNDVDIDVVFTRNSDSWRVPAFWRGGQQWTVRFAPPVPGKYAYRVESTDKGNSDLNGRSGTIKISPYTGSNKLLSHGMLRVSDDKRHFEHADGTPFYWLGDTWYTGLSDRLPWAGFRKLVADRKDKGFTVVLVCAGLVPDEEVAPVDPGYSNEGGPVWDAKFGSINPQYFDYADRRIQLLTDMGIVPAIVGGWNSVLVKMGVAKMKKHWRYIIARYGAYPVFWIGGGEVYDPPDVDSKTQNPKQSLLSAWRAPGWTDIVRYIRATDPYRHPLTVHEVSGEDVSLQDPSLTDFDLSQPSHFGWSSIAIEVAQLNMRYARTAIVKPFVVGEVGYEMIGNTNLEDFQRVAFWLSMLNGAAGHTYGSIPIVASNNPDKPLHRLGQYTFLSWEEGMNLRGAYQIGLGAKLLQKYPWWDFKPHPEWITPRGTTVLERRPGIVGFDIGDSSTAFHLDMSPTDEFMTRPEAVYPAGEWKSHGGNFHQPYAAGVPKRVRIIYIPSLGLLIPPPPTVLGLEKGVNYRAFYWEPTLGIKFDLGTVCAPAAGAQVLLDRFDGSKAEAWVERGTGRMRHEKGELVSNGDTQTLNNIVSLEDAVVSTQGRSDASAGLLMRYENPDNFVVAMYSPKERLLYIYRRANGTDGSRLGAVPITSLGAQLRLTAEIRRNMAAASISDGKNTFQTPIVDVLENSPWIDASNIRINAGAFGIMHTDDGTDQHFESFELRQSPILPTDEHLSRQLFDAQGNYRGELDGPRWREFGMNKAILLDSYRPDAFPSLQDWILVLDAANRANAQH